MYTVKVKGKFVAGCANFRNHTWIVEATFSGLQLDNVNVLIDPIEVKAGLDSILEALDHTDLNDVIGENNITTELLARLVWEELRALFPKELSRLVQEVTVWKDRNYSVTYMEH